MNTKMKPKDTQKPKAEPDTSFDWEGARLRLAAVSTALEGLDETTPEMLEQIWSQRAARLAQVPTREDEGEHLEIVLLKLGQETYGIDARFVFAIRPTEEMTRVPRVPQWVAGVVNIRGRIFSVIDLARFFGLPEAPPVQENDSGTEDSEKTPSLIVVETPAMEVALLTRQVVAVESLPAAHLQDPTSTLRGIPAEYVKGIVERKQDDTLAVVLDLPALLADERLIIHEEIV